MIKNNVELVIECFKLVVDFNDGKISKKELYQKGMQITLDKWESAKENPADTAYGWVTCGCCAIAEALELEQLTIFGISSDSGCTGCPIYETNHKYDRCHNTPFMNILLSFQKESLLNGPTVEMIEAEIKFLNEIFEKFKRR